VGDVGRLLILFGVLLVLVGVLLTFAPRISLPRLPGDIVVQRDGFTFYFPIVTSIVISVVLTLLLNALWWVRR
jgi:formate hydrogenlyase subunit 3/multisubunit Na+/H+ antiporter MnhD subunit